MSEDHAMTINPAFVVTRKVPVPTTDALVAALEALPGMEQAGTDADGRLTIRYDASLLGFPDIERVLDVAGAVRPDSLWWRFRAEWFRFTDGNARANAHATHACCSRPPVPPSSTGRK